MSAIHALRELQAKVQRHASEQVGALGGGKIDINV